MGYVIAFVLFIVMMFVRPGGILAKRAMSARPLGARASSSRRSPRCRSSPWAACGSTCCTWSSRSSSGPSSAARGRSWAASASSRSATARSSASGAYTTTLLWNFYGLTPWIGVLRGRGWRRSCSRSWSSPIRAPASAIVGHYFGLVTLAVGEVVRLLHHRRARLDGRLARAHAEDRPATRACCAIQFADKRVFYYGALVVWLGGLWVWHRAGPVDGALGHGGHRRGRDGGRLGRHPRARASSSRITVALGRAHRGGRRRSTRSTSPT